MYLFVSEFHSVVSVNDFSEIFYSDILFLASNRKYVNVTLKIEEAHIFFGELDRQCPETNI